MNSRHVAIALFGISAMIVGMIAMRFSYAPDVPAAFAQSFNHSGMFRGILAGLSASVLGTYVWRCGVSLSQQRKWHVFYASIVLCLLTFDVLPLLSALVAVAYSFNWARSANSDSKT
jgi:hypothetical protein